MELIKLSAEDKLTKARIQLSYRNSFFSYLVMHLNFIKDNKFCPTAGVDYKGNVLYNEQFIEKLTINQVIGLLCHEVMHCALNHLQREKDLIVDKRYKRIANIAKDIVINNFIVNAHMELPGGTYVPSNNSISVHGFTIKNISEKSWEDVYFELIKHIKDGDVDLEKFSNGFDVHIISDSNGSESGKEDKESEDKQNALANANVDENGKDWKRILTEALQFAKNRGDLPGGMERVVEKILESHIDWKGLLYRYITSEIPVDFTWARPSKRSYSLNVYTPNIIKEQVDIIVSIDTSGSIGTDELEEFVSEIVGVINSFEAVKLTVIVCDATVQGVFRFNNPQKSEILSKLKLKGGGGTSHIPVYEYIEKHIPNAKLLINFTDGMTEFPKRKDYPFKTIWVLGGSWRIDKNRIPFGNVIELPRRA